MGTGRRKEMMVVSRVTAHTCSHVVNLTQISLGDS